MKVDGIELRRLDEARYYVHGYIKRDDTDEVTAAGLRANAKPHQAWRPQDGWIHLGCHLDADDVRAIGDVTDTFGRLFLIAEVLAERGTKPNEADLLDPPTGSEQP